MPPPPPIQGNNNNNNKLQQQYSINANVKLSLCMPWRQSAAEVFLHSFLTLPTTWRWVIHFTPWPLFPQERTSVPTEKKAGWDDLNTLKKRQMFYPCHKSNPGLSSPWPSHCTNYHSFKLNLVHPL